MKATKMNGTNSGAPACKRRYVRKAIGCRGALSNAIETCHATLLEISEGGLLFSCAKDLHLGEGLELQFYLTKSRHLVLRGAVVYLVRKENHTLGKYYGLRFVDLDIFNKMLIQSFIRQSKS